MNDAWPALPVDSWQPTRDSLILWLQVVGKIRIARTPLLNHWWNAPLYLTARGLTTSLMPADAGRSFAIDLDLLDHQVAVTTTLGQSRTMQLEPMTVKDFHSGLTDLLDGMGLSTDIWPVPVELPDAIPFPDDTTHHSYDPRSVTAFWRTLVQIERASSTSSGPGSWASPAPSTSSGAPSTWPPPGSPDDLLHRTRAECRTVDPK